jgi:hypothetical protein
MLGIMSDTFSLCAVDVYMRQIDKKSWKMWADGWLAKVAVYDIMAIKTWNK